ncbi:beta-lactamase family protein [Parvularcula flava]|uniref:Beta-lactamase family protein n=1 Tax=Aquisalinus luteolus TaxID=1566827 RepID=A0A8J3AAU4_9PROT|nr:serine hydrolase domain-containing protein [Aquisalinus luteolus]NHK29242.1 beta-lactamase family protein [Aquisalinus luteolus]GGI01373.1 hypothetical protein GCM10011355_31860 [Aquisalinus luteolus]
MRFVLVALLLGIATALHAGIHQESIEKIIAVELPLSGAPGLSYAVLDDSDIMSGAHGEMVAGSGREISPDTPFVLGSIAKSFTALAVMQLVESGQVDLDAEIHQYLDGFAESPGRNVTIRQLLSHTSGYSTFQGNDSLSGEGASADGLSRQVARIAQWSPAHEPGTRWEYSNANYYVLGALIEELSGQDYARYVETQILEPIGMEHSFVADGGVHETARGHVPWFGGKRALKEAASDRMSAPVGGIIATARDTALYLAVMMNGEDDIISARGKVEMMQPASEVSPFYGFGWYLDTANGTVSHTGLTPGVETLAIMKPAERKAAVVLINASSGMGFGENANLMNAISARALGLDYTPAGDAGRWSRMGLFLLFALLPVLFVVGIVQVALSRAGLRAKSGVSGAFSLWFPMLTTIALAWVCIFLVPQLFGVSMGTLQRYSPDLALALVASAVAGVAWAVLRLVLYYSGPRAAT